MNLLDKFSELADVHQQLQEFGSDPTRVTVDGMLSATEAVIRGKRVVMFGTNNYLGLTFAKECIVAGQRALEQAGTGTTGSRMANGNYAEHEALEQDLAKFYGLPNAMVFSTGYGANLGTLTGLLQSGDCVLLDADAHASLYDGARMSGAEIYRFKHNDVESLNARLRRLKDRVSRTLIVTEGLYSILGDTAPMAEIVALKKQYGAYLLVDEAHSLGIYGDTGRGVCDAQGVQDGVDFIVGTFSKSLGTTGGFCVSAHNELGLLRYSSRPFIFTASQSPAVVASTRAALALLRDGEALRRAVWRNAHMLYEGLKSAGWTLGPEVSPVVAIRFDDKQRAQATWHALVDAGVYTNLVVPPASPDGSSLLRCSVSAAHTPEQIAEALTAFGRASEGTRRLAEGAASV